MIVFGERLRSVFAERGHLCVGIDPHRYLLERWGLEDSAEGLRHFGLAVVAASAGEVGIVKPQVAFFERFGSAGFAALEAVLAAARAAGLLVIADAKRGDIGTSVEAYGSAWLTPGAPLEADALTVSAFQGVGSLAAPADLAQAAGKGLFVLAATSNPESIAGQTAVVGRGEFTGSTVSASIVSEVSRRNTGPLGSIGVVIGATISLAEFGIAEADLATVPILAPGFGHQGVGFDAVHTIYGSAARNVVVSSSRGVLEAGPDGLAAAISEQASRLREVFAE